jgi:class 3 adenylate cyclase
MDFQNITTPTECELVLAVIDLASFARTAQTMSDRAIFDLLSEFYELVGTTTEAEGGRVVKFMGDAALIVFAGDNPDQAVRKLRLLKNAIETWLAAYDPELKLLIKAHLGRVVCGPLGMVSDKRFDVIGRAVNDLFLMERGDFVLSGPLKQRLGSDHSQEK